MSTLTTLPNPDAFEDPNFDPVEYINCHFSDEQSLQSLDALSEVISQRLVQVDQHILPAVEVQATMGARAEQGLTATRTSMESLCSKVKEIKQKADEAESMVVDICAEIRALDTAKQNLTLSIKCLRWIQMLENALTGLSSAASAEDYQQCTSLMDAAKQLLVHFEDQQDVPRIRAMSAQLNALRTDLREKVMEKFTKIQLEKGVPANFGDVCTLVSLMGEETESEFTKNFLKTQLDGYRRSFRSGEEVGRLCHTEKRYQWFRRFLNEFEENVGRVAPSKWNLPQELAVEFCLITHADLTQELQVEPNTVETLVSSLSKTLAFEKELSSRWKAADSKGQGQSSTDEADAEELNALSEAERIKRKYKKHAKQKQKAERREQTSIDASAKIDAKLTSLKKYKYNGLIAPCFENSMAVYISFEDCQLAETVEKLLSEETWGPSSADSSEGMVDNTEVLSSAVDLLIYIRGSLKRCSELSRGQTLCAMHKVWGKHLVSYATKVSAQIPAKVTEKDDRLLCLIVNTAEYWLTSIGHLSAEIQSKIDELLVQQISFEAEADAFSAMLHRAIRALIRSIEGKLEPVLNDMLKINWTQVTSVGDQSGYTAAVAQILMGRAGAFAKYLSPTHLRFFCDKFAASFAYKFTQCFYKCKRISDNGCQQLLLDTQCLKKTLEGMPLAGNPERISGAAMESHEKIVQVEMRRPEHLLKLLLLPAVDREAVGQYVANVPRPSVPEFIRIMELKGVKRVDIQPLIDLLSLNKKVSKTEPVFEDDDQHCKDSSILEDWKRKWKAVKPSLIGGLSD
eukprot:RCo042538